MGLGEMGQSMMIDGFGEVNLDKIRETMHARELKIK